MSKRPFLFLAGIVMVSSVFVPHVSAIEESFYSGNDILFYNPDESCANFNGAIQPVSEGAPVDDPQETKDRARVIMQYFVDRGLTLAAAAGFIGNMTQESGLNPAIIQGGANARPAQKDAAGVVTDTSTIYKPVNSVGFGLVQWTFGGTSAPRQGPLYNRAVSSKIDISDIGLQLDYVWAELNAGYKTSTLDRIKGISDPIEAAIIIHDNYEISADSDSAVRTVRGGTAKRYFDMFKGQINDSSGATVNTTTTTTTTGNSCEVVNTAGGSGNGGVGAANGYTFPLKSTKADIKKGADGTAWCVDNLTNCHANYNAADIFAETGTPIVAVKAGNVVSKTTDACGSYGCNVSVMGTDGVLYYYTHMSKQATVSVGKQVQAGDVIGSVGTNASAVGTPRHLHFDMLPGDKYNFRPSCASAECKGYPFINVQQYLVPAYNTLPEGGTLDV